MREATAKVADYAGQLHHIRWDALVAALAPWIEHGVNVAAGADLRADAPPRTPRITYEDAYTPNPLPLEDEDEDEDGP